MSSREWSAEPISQLGFAAERVIEAGWLTAVAAVPLYFDVYSSRVFEPDKTILLRCIVLLMLLAQAIRLSEGRAVTTAGQPRTFGKKSPESMTRRLAATNALFVPVAVLIVVEFLSTALSIAPSISFFGSYQRLQGTYTFFTYVSLFFLVAVNLRTPDQFRRIVLVVLLTSLPITVYGVVQHLQLDPLPWGGDVVFRVTSTMGNAIFLAAYLIMVIPLTAARLVATVTRLRDANPRGGDDPGRPALRWAAIVAGQNALLAGMMIGSAVNQNIWWAAPGVIGLFTLLASGPAVPRPSRALLQVETVALSGLLSLQVACVFLTQSRGPWLGLLAGGIVLVILLEVRNRAARRLLIGTIALFVVSASILVVFNVPSSPLARYRDLPYLGRLGQLGDVSDGTGKVRVLIWQGTFDLLAHHPTIGFTPDPLGPLRVIVGYGPEAMHLAYNAVYPPALGDLESRNASPDRNHNDLLDYVVTTGLIGLVAYLVLVVLALRLGWRVFRRGRTLTETALVAGLLGGIVAHLVETQTGIAVVSTQTYFWVMLALLVVVARQPDVVRDPEERSTENLLLIVGGAPSSTKQRRGAKRAPPLAPATRPPTVPAKGPLPRWAILGGYATVVVVGIAIATTLASQGLIGAQVMLYVAFLLLAGSLIAYAVERGQSSSLAAMKPRTFWVAVAGGVVVAIALGLNLNGIAADVYQKQGATLDSQQRVPESSRAFASALALAPTQDYYALFLGRAYLEVATAATSQPGPPGPTPGTFHPNLETLFTITPSTVVQLSRADALAASEVALIRARDLGPLDPDHYANLARLYRLWGETVDPTKLDLAAKNLSLATTLSPHSAQLYDEWAVTSMTQGNLSDALTKARTAVTLDPVYAVPHLILGDVYLAQKDVDNALSEHLRALELDPISLSDGSFESRVSTYVSSGKGQILADKYRLLLQTNSSRSVRLSYAYLLTQIGQTPQAIEQFRLVAQGDPTDWLAARNLAVAYAKEGDRANARAAATQALQYAPAAQRAEIQSMIDSLGK